MSLRRTKGKKYWLDIGIFFLFFVSCYYFYHQIQNKLVYKWRWEDLWVYFVRLDSEQGAWLLNTLSFGIISTIKIILWAFFLSLLVGFVLAIMKNSSIKSISWLAISYIHFVRNIPSLVFLFLFYFFFSSQIFPVLGLDFLVANLSENQKTVVEFFFIKTSLLENFISGFISLALLESAYIGEVIWAGIVSIEKTQWESGYSLGMSKFKVLRHIILPQAIYKISPALTGQCINLIKDSSILSIISIQELSFSANNVIATSNLRFETWIIVALIYFFLCFSLSLLSKKFEKKVRYL